MPARQLSDRAIGKLPVSWVAAFIMLWNKTQHYHAPDWKKWLGSLVPGWVLDGALLRLLPPVSWQQLPVPTSFPPDTPDGRSRKARCTGHYTVEGEVFLARLVRTRDGRELLQHKLIKEREDVDSPAIG